MGRVERHSNLCKNPIRAHDFPPFSIYNGEGMGKNKNPLASIFQESKGFCAKETGLHWFYVTISSI
ncbi:hypothetical protein P872_01910 [Rhodonellum psychrophilum GCM71 = DSM 17998]|uniref:Uncharacterized protein n=1 Tax=Rhodonellum psychrophilum GCM71 = DSM 17998 TaxID=1123057 RepID=U5C1V3_9BACT|nr:hypothetical protein P872_01910 [Rhodonellum psychrophilum GCM71 = DSM 17998]